MVEYPFDFDMALWLAEKFPKDVVIDWEAYNDLEADNLAKNCWEKLSELVSQ